ncbi:histidine phosphatase family protein [soil metagenome]
MTRQLVLWRHGRTAWNVEGRTQGQSDTDLDEVGVAQAAEGASRLAALAPSAIVSSDLRRAVDTAAPLAKLTDLVPTYDRRLREVDFGAREGLTAEDAWQRWPEEMARRDAGEDVRFPGAETLAETADRFAAVLSEVSRAMSYGETVVVVGHGSAMRVGACAFVGFPTEHRTRFGAFANCCWAVLADSGRGWRIEEWNAGSLPEPVVGDDR